MPTGRYRLTQQSGRALSSRPLHQHLPAHAKKHLSPVQARSYRMEPSAPPPQTAIPASAARPCAHTRPPSVGACTGRSAPADRQRYGGTPRRAGPKSRTSGHHSGRTAPPLRQLQPASLRARHPKARSGFRPPCARVPKACRRFPSWPQFTVNGSPPIGMGSPLKRGNEKSRTTPRMHRPVAFSLSMLAFVTDPDGWMTNRAR